MTGKIDRVEVITSVQRRRRWSAEEKTRIVQETYAPGMSVSLVARRYGIAPNQLFSWRRLYAEGALSAVGAGEEVVPASEYRALQHQVRELQRLLGKKTLENEILREALDLVQPKKTAVAVALARSRGYAVKTVAEALGVARSNLVVRVAAETTRQRRGRRPAPEDQLLAEISEIIATQPTYGYRRVRALLRRRRAEQGAAPVNVKRVYRIMKAHGLLLQRPTGDGEERRHDGRVAVDSSDTRWCSDGFEIACDNGERVRLAFTLDCCDREAIAFKRDYAKVSPRPDAATVLRQLDGWFEHYNTVHPHKALGYRSPREFRKQTMIEKTTANAVGAVRRAHGGTKDGMGSGA
jgi:transposase-like protein